MSTMQIITTLVVIIIIALLVIGAVFVVRRRALRQQFGPEYERVVEEQPSRSAAERELRDRQRRHADLKLRDLSAEERAAYAAEWDDVQARFVDAPEEAAGQAEKLIHRLAAARGYPAGDYDEQLAQLSVEHANVLGNYRDAHDISQRGSEGDASTEQLRVAIVRYRVLVSDLLGEASRDAAKRRQPESAGGATSTGRDTNTSRR
jgi:hypothetical protein